jgi:cation:H+ antiporter
MVHLLLLAAGFTLLVKGADFLVEGSSSLAKKLRVSEIVIGLTVVAFGTSAPELAINVIAAARGSVDIAFGNIVGSNLINILVILGISGLIFPLKVQKNTVWKEIPFLLFSSVLVFLLANDSLLWGRTESVLSRIDSLILLSGFAFFSIYVFMISRVRADSAPEIRTRSVRASVLLSLTGLAALLIGGKLAVDSAVSLARTFGISEHIIAVTVIALGTSLPELFTSAVAAFKRRIDLAIGNIVGSCIFNALLVLGLTGLIRPMQYSYALNLDMLFLLLASGLLFLAMFTGRRRVLDRWESGVFLVIYAAYLFMLLF